MALTETKEISFKGLRAYFYAIAKSVSTIMVSYSSWNGVKKQVNRCLLSDVLKRHLGFLILEFQGIDLVIDLVGVNYSNFIWITINAGIDMV